MNTPNLIRPLVLSLSLGMALSIPLVAAASGNSDTYRAKIWRTEGGIPHIKANEYASLGFGTGYASAEDNFCAQMDNFVTLAGQRSLYHGPGVFDSNVNSDFFNQLQQDRNIADHENPQELEDLYRGWAAGFNRYLRDVGGADGIDDPACQSADWVREITAREVNHLNQIDFFLGGFSFLITNASPPVPVPLAAASSATPLDGQMAAMIDELANPGDKGSNGVGIGRDASQSGNAMLFTNPHLGWNGVDRRFYPFHQIIPGELNILGANIISRSQLVGFGTNGDIATTTTVSTADGFQFYNLILPIPGQPTSYLLDGVPTPMTEETVVVTVNDGGVLEQRSHTFYSTVFGMVIEAGFFPWTDSGAFTVRLGDIGARGGPAQVALWQSETVHELKAVHDQYQHTTANMTAVDVNGEAIFATVGPYANFPDSLAATPNGIFGNCGLGGGVGAGWASHCNWQTDPDSATTGIYGPSNLPFLVRTDYVTNSNDSHWLTNPAEPLTGFNSNVGNEAGERTLRTRSGLNIVMDRIAGTDGLGGSGFTLDLLQELTLSNQNQAGVALRDDLVKLCLANPSVVLGSDASVVDLSGACTALANWDLHDNLDSTGVHVFREFLREANGGSNTRFLPSTLNYVLPFDISDPTNTPRGLDLANNDAALQFLGEAVKKLTNDGIALDARLGDLQSVTRNGERIEIHGGPEWTGVFNKVDARYAGA